MPLTVVLTVSDVIVALVDTDNVVKAPVEAVLLPMAPGAAKVAPFKEDAFKLATLFVDVTTNGAVPDATVDVN